MKRYFKKIDDHPEADEKIVIILDSDITRLSSVNGLLTHNEDGELAPAEDVLLLDDCYIDLEDGSIVNIMSHDVRWDKTKREYYDPTNEKIEVSDLPELFQVGIWDDGGSFRCWWLEGPDGYYDFEEVTDDMPFDDLHKECKVISRERINPGLVRIDYLHEESERQFTYYANDWQGSYSHFEEIV